ncbi:MAG: phage terminase large subunit [Candidatus Brocadiia bacterium]
MGPVGSSKSSACCNELLMRAFEQEPWEDGVRRTKFAIVRRTYSELKLTTLRTWQEWCPDSVCHISQSPPLIGRMIRDLPDGTQVDMEVIFLAMDEPSDEDKLRSLEVTMVWINEAREVLEKHFQIAQTRLRYPPPRWGGPTFRGIIMDTNPPSEKSWYYRLAEVERPDNHEFFQQPPAVIEVPTGDIMEPYRYIPNTGGHGFDPAENVSNLVGGWDYYLQLIPGKNREWIRVNVQGFYGVTLAGQPVFPEYRDEIHCAKVPLEYHRGLPVVAGMDFGTTPSVVFCQLAFGGQFRAIDELWSDQMGISRFARDMLIPYVRNKLPGMKIYYVTDPAGNQRDQTNESTCLDVLRDAGITAEMAISNLFVPRREAVAYYLMQMRDGQPGFLISPKCDKLRSALKGEYCYKTSRTSEGIISSDRPDKHNPYTHVADALEYAALHTKSGFVMSSLNTDFNTNTTCARPIESVNWTP